MINWLAHSLREAIAPRRSSSTPPPPPHDDVPEPTIRFVLTSAAASARAASSANLGDLRASSRQLLVETQRFREDVDGAQAT